MVDILVEVREGGGFSEGPRGIMFLPQRLPHFGPKITHNGNWAQLIDRPTPVYLICAI